MTQIFANALISSACYMLVGIGFALMYSTTRFFNMAHGILLTVAAYATFWLRSAAGWPLAMAAIGGVSAGTLVGMAFERAVFRPLRLRSASPSALLLASLGLYVTFQALIMMMFGASTRTFRGGIDFSAISLAGAKVTSPQLAMIGVGVLTCVIGDRFLARTTTGRRFRAVSNDPSLAEISGLGIASIMMAVVVVSSTLAGIAGVLIAADTDLTPAMGLRPLLYAMIAFVIGGTKRLRGIVFGSLILGFVQHFSAWWLSSQWQDSIVFITLLVVMLVFPNGLRIVTIQKS
jgi:branched-chain amino acid transport system permease protein